MFITLLLIKYIAFAEDQYPKWWACNESFSRTFCDGIIICHTVYLC